MNDLFKITQSDVLQFSTGKNHSNGDQELMKSLSMISNECREISELADLQLVLNNDLGDYEEQFLDSPFTKSLGYESVAKIKNTLSRVKSNIVMYSKKFFSFVINFFTNLVGSNIDTKTLLAKYYKKAVEYKKTMDTYATKEMSSETKVEVGNHWKRIALSISVLAGLCSIYEAALDNLSTVQDPSDKLTTFTLTILSISLLFLSEVSEDGKLSNSNKTLEQAGYDINKMPFVDEIKNKSAALWTKITDFVKNRKADKDNPTDFDKAVKEITSMNFEELSKKMKETDITKSAVHQMLHNDEMEKKELGLTEAFNFVKNELDQFINTCKGNKWDFKRVSDKINKEKSKLSSVLSKSTSNVDSKAENSEKLVKEMNDQLKAIMLSGEALSKTDKVVKSLNKNLSKDLEALFTDVSMIGSKVS